MDDPKSPLDLKHGDPERRVDDLGRKAFDRAVGAAATIATQNVAQVHRRRLVLQSSIVTFMICLAIALVMALTLKGAADANAHKQALSNCRLVRDISGPMADFVTSDAHLRQRQQALSEKGQIAAGFTKLFGKTAYAQALKESNALNAATAKRWLSLDVPELRRVAGTDCELRIP